MQNSLDEFEKDDSGNRASPTESANRKMRPKDFISIYSGLPISFIPSFIREEQQKNNLLPSKCLQPLIKNDIFYEDIYPCETLIYQNNEPNSITGIIQTYKKFINNSEGRKRLYTKSFS